MIYDVNSPLFRSFLSQKGGSSDKRKAEEQKPKEQKPKATLEAYNSVILEASHELAVPRNLYDENLIGLWVSCGQLINGGVVNVGLLKLQLPNFQLFRHLFSSTVELVCGANFTP
ncbi:hypothetical protein ACH5RR_020421 [Cinchona calisaya]|uniref:Uncharacterized protein n=1 Tax=Cinchona calisaya TaxID=153742 RepID=A0ABD2ZI78_9GENT